MDKFRNARLVQQLKGLELDSVQINNPPDESVF